MSLNDHELATVAGTIAAAALGFNMTGRKPSDLYKAIAERLADAGLLQSPEVAADHERLRARTLYLADYEGASDGPTLWTTEAEATAWCDGYARSEARGRSWDWLADGAAVQMVWVREVDDAALAEGPGRVTPLVAGQAGGER
ncbi:hypothetical protein AB0F42_24265 [Streptomyces buecherae]|uniref:hypothetical protein n=1 Tax=Streptomyces buecherae TaxID=2763006 RepID=UPI0033C4E934